MTSSRPIEVAIVGGGCAGVAAAFELTRPEHGGRFHVTLYQQGWRLGGKGASGRGVDGRIEEHGLHLWMGYYENAFRLLRECYDELRAVRRPDYWDWRDAFRPVSAVGVEERQHGSTWESWLAHFPENDLTPGDPHSQWKALTPLDYLVRGIQLALTLLQSASGRRPAANRVDLNQIYGAGSADFLRVMTNLLAEGLPYGEALVLISVREVFGVLQQILAGMPVPSDLTGRLGDIFESFQKGLDRRVEDLAENDHGQRRTLEMAEVILANMRGMVRFGLLSDPRGFDAIDDYEYRDWLKLSGASDRTIDSAILRGLYDLAFAYEDGDVKRPRFSAGQALRSSMRAFFTYKGALFWKMNAGMGDVVFAPFYEVLSARGMSFEFFHRLKRVELSSPGAKGGADPHVAALHFDVQARVRDGCEYQPLVEINGLPCWPARPDYVQLLDDDGSNLKRRDFESHWETGRADTRTLRVSRDFDFVVLAVGLGAVPFVCEELVQSNTRWRQMVEHVKTVPTQALQLWLKPGLAELGWRHGSFDVSGFAEPFDTWADMSHFADVENHTEKPGSIAYFCSVLPDTEPLPPQTDQRYPKRKAAEVHSNAVRFLNDDIGHIWPQAVSGEYGFRWDLLQDASRKKGPARLDSQYWRANVNPSDRYILSLPGTGRFRISPLELTCDNLTIAGDWTDCGYNAGCVEAAFMSGRLAAHALSGNPPLEEIVGFDHP